MLHHVYTAPRAILAQFGLGFALAAALLIWGVVPAYSALIGGLVAASGSAFFALGVFGRYQAPQLGALAGRLVAAELLKLAWAAVLFLLAVRTVHPLSPAAMFLTFLAVQLVPAVVAVTADRQSTVERAGSWPPKR
jgi:F0F1-type ATP synthase assembly protein I